LPIVQPELNAELNAMSDDEFAAILGAADQQVAQQLARAQACLDLFEKDRGRRANNALDIRVWADVQVPENLRFGYCAVYALLRSGPKRASASGMTSRRRWLRGHRWDSAYFSR
jgi:hypothetical protein